MNRRGLLATLFCGLGVLLLLLATPAGEARAPQYLAAAEPTNTPTRPPTVPPVSPAPVTPPSPAPACQELVINGGFEEDAAWDFPVTASRAGYTTAAAHGGTRSARLGLPPWQDLVDPRRPAGVERNLAGELAPGNASFSAAYQTISLPTLAGSFTLTFFYKPGSQGAGGDYQRVMLLNPDGYTYIATLMQVLEDGDAWQLATFDLTPYRGQTIALYFEVFNDNISAGPRTWMFLDDVSVHRCSATPPPPLTATPTPSATPSGDLTLTGYVYDAAVGREQPIGGAMVTVDTCQHRSFATLTGTDGRYALPLPGNKLNICPTVTLSGWAPGYATLERASAVDELRQHPQADFGLWPMGDITVTTAEDELNADGDCSLREAVQAANNDRPVDACPGGGGSVTVVIPAGVYPLALVGTGEDANLTGDLDITGNLKLIGAGVKSTVIDGQGLDRVLDIHGGATVQISGVMVTGGRTPDGPDSPSGEGDAAPGGGIANAGDLILSGCGVSGNRTGDGGDLTGGSWSGGPRGGSGGDGGGIYNSGAIQVYDTWVSNNITGSGGTGGSTGIGLAGRGGGIYSAGKLTLDRAAVEQNLCGGGGSQVLLPDVMGGAGGAGGGIYNAGAAVIAHSTVANNRAGDGRSAGSHGAGGRGGDGGGILTRGELLLRQSTVNGNSGGAGGSAWVCGAGGDGGGITSLTGSLSLVNSTVSGNLTGAGGTSYVYGRCPDGNGGGMYTVSGARVDNSTITANHASGAGGGFFIVEQYASLRNTILAGNTAAEKGPNCGGDGVWSSLHLVGYNLIQEHEGCLSIMDPADGPNIFGKDPLLLPLGKYGGPTLTHALKSGSPALDAGFCTDMCGDIVKEDQRGVSRPQGRVCDIGAFEGQPARVYLPLMAVVGTGVPELLYFRAIPQDSTSIVLEWATAAELDTVAFGVYRSHDPAAPGPPITLIPAHGDAVTGAIYRYLDTDIAPGVLYNYMLARLTASGGMTIIATATARTDPTPSPLPTATPAPSATPEGGFAITG